MRRPALAVMLTDIHSWLGDLAQANDTTRGIKAARTTPAGPRRGEPPLPFGLAATTDQLDDGMPGARTPTGITRILRGWADSVAAARGEPVHGHPALYLAAVADWVQEHFGDAESLTEDVATAWDRIAAVTGRADQVDPDRVCPACGGRLVQGTTPRGLSDWRVCSGCDAWFPDGEVIDATRRHAVTSQDSTGGVWATTSEVLALHPHLSAALVRQWVHRGHVARDGRGRVCLGDVNRRVAASRR